MKNNIYKAILAWNNIWRWSAYTVYYIHVCIEIRVSFHETCIWFISFFSFRVLLYFRNARPGLAGKITHIRKTSVHFYASIWKVVIKCDRIEKSCLMHVPIYYEHVGVLGWGGGNVEHILPNLQTCNTIHIFIYI